MGRKSLIYFLSIVTITALTLGTLVLIKDSSFSSLPDNPSLSIRSPLPSATLTLTPSLTPTSLPPTPSLTPKPTSKPTPKTVSGPPVPGLNYLTVATQKGNFNAQVLMIDLNTAKVIIDTANDSDCTSDCPVISLQNYVSRNGGFAGVNGSYFCPEAYPECSGKKNSFDFPVYNSRLNKWINGKNLFWDNRSMVYFDGSGGHYLQNAKDFNGGLLAGIVNHPGLLENGNIRIDDNQSGLSDKQKAKGTKVGIGIVSNKSVLVVVAQNVNMQEFAYVFKSLGAKGALNLDTGGSTGLYFSGKYVAGPGRNLPNAIIFAR